MTNKPIQLHRNIRLYYLFVFLRNLFLISAVIIPFFSEWGGLNQAQIQILQSSFMVSVFIFEVPTGVIADRFSRKLSLILGNVVVIIGIGVYVYQKSFINFMFGEIIFALGVALVSGANKALLYDSLIELNKEKLSKKILTNAESFKMAGILISGLLGGWLSSFFTPNIIFGLTVIPMTLSLIASMFFIEPDVHKSGEIQRWSKIFKEGVKVFIRDTNLRKHAVDMIFISMISYFVIWFYQTKLVAIGVPAHLFGYFVVLLSLSQILVLQLMPNIEKIVGGEKKYLGISALITAIGFLIVSVWDHWLGVLLFVVLSGGFGLSRRPIYTAIYNKYIPSKQRATVNSFINMLRSIVIAVINPVMGALVDWDLDNTLLVLSFLAVVAFFFSVTVNSRVE